MATNPFFQAALLLLFGHWQIAAWLLVVWTFVHAVAVALGARRISRVTDAEIFTAPDWLFVLGNEQEGYTPQWYLDLHPKWPWWLSAFVWCAWRNKLRNLPFIPWLSWLHKPKGALYTIETGIGDLLLRMRYRGWMTELEYQYDRRFGDFGPRLDQPDEWGGVSWAWRPWGRY